MDVLAKRCGYTHEDLAKRLGKSRTSVTESLSLTGMPVEVRKLCRLADISSKSLLLQIVRQQTPEKMVGLIEQLTKGGAAATREQARKAVATKPRLGRPRAFVFKYRPPAKTFDLRLQFKKSDVDRAGSHRRPRSHHQRTPLGELTPQGVLALDARHGSAGRGTQLDQTRSVRATTGKPRRTAPVARKAVRQSW